MAECPSVYSVNGAMESSNLGGPLARRWRLMADTAYVFSLAFWRRDSMGRRRHDGVRQFEGWKR
jgi:hypothetical protein